MPRPTLSELCKESRERKKAAQAEAKAQAKRMKNFEAKKKRLFAAVGNLSDEDWQQCQIERLAKAQAKAKAAAAPKPKPKPKAKAKAKAAAAAN